MPFEELTAVSSVDGRYRSIVAALAPYLSESALIRNRVKVECAYFIALSQTKSLRMRSLTLREKQLIEKIGNNFSLADARSVQQLERAGKGKRPATNHDVKAMEYFLRDKLARTSLKNTLEWIHFAITSEDTNSVAYALGVRGALETVLLPALEEIRAHLDDLAMAHAATPMLARTHGQSASPTTFGKEMRVFETRLARQIDQLEKRSILVKWSGATGNYNAHIVAAPEVSWPAFAKKFVLNFNAPEGGKKHPIRLALNEITTQIEPHDSYAELFDALRRINVILIDLSQDIWRYISDGWLSQKVKRGEVGSSTMPHKVNPIDFENAEGNLGLGNALFEHFSRKLPISRLQRDLSDSTVERAFGTAFGHSLIAYKSILRGFAKIAVNKEAMQEVLTAHPEVLAEAIQTTLRRAGIPGAYEELKEMSRDRLITLPEIKEFLEKTKLPEQLRKRLLALKPQRYIGDAAHIARKRNIL